MPRSLTNPLTGQIVWYYAASPPAAAPQAAMVVASLTGRPVSLTASAMTWANGVVTATVPSQNDRIGTIYPITVAGVTPAGYNGSYQGTLTGPTTITFPLATNPGPVTVQGTVAYNSGYTAAGIPAQFYNLTVFDPSAGTVAAQNAVPFLYGIRQASGAWCTMMRVNENLPGAWPTQLEALQYAEHGLTPDQKTQAGLMRVAEAQAAAQAAAAGNGNPGTHAEDEDPDAEPPHSRSTTRTTTRTTTRSTHR